MPALRRRQGSETRGMQRVKQGRTHGFQCRMLQEAMCHLLEEDSFCQLLCRLLAQRYCRRVRLCNSQICRWPDVLPHLVCRVCRPSVTSTLLLLLRNQHRCRVSRLSARQNLEEPAQHVLLLERNVMQLVHGACGTCAPGCAGFTCWGTSRCRSKSQSQKEAEEGQG